MLLFRMVSILSFILIASSTLAANISGFIVLDKKDQYLVSTDSNQKYLLKPTNVETQENLKRLKNHDFLIGNGSIINGDLLLESIDFVGLRELLGLWTSQESWLNFKDYNKVTVFSSETLSPKARSDISYSIAPGSNGDWKIFFSDTDNVAVASLLLKKETAELQFYDVSTGQISQVVQLKRLPVTQ